VYPLRAEAAFEYAARLGYDGVELMVWGESVSQDINAVKKLSRRYRVPVLSVHAPCLLISQRVWGANPIPKLERSVRAAEKLEAQTVVVHPPFRWQRRYAEGFSDQVSALEATSNVMIAVDFGRNERGLDGFDPDAEVDGLDFALRNPGHGRSEYVWNVLLAPNRRLVAGAVERSVLQSFSDSSLENAASAIGMAAEREAWLPGRDGTFRRPGELSLDDLPPTYTRDEGLAQALHMLQPAVAEAARQLGIPPAVLWGLSARPDLVAMIERELGEQP